MHIHSALSPDEQVQEHVHVHPARIGESATLAAQPVLHESAVLERGETDAVFDGDEGDVDDPLYERRLRGSLAREEGLEVLDQLLNWHFAPGVLPQAEGRCTGRRGRRRMASARRTRRSIAEG